MPLFKLDNGLLRLDYVMFFERKADCYKLHLANGDFLPVSLAVGEEMLNVVQGKAMVDLLYQPYVVEPPAREKPTTAPQSPNRGQRRAAATQGAQSETSAK